MDDPRMGLISGTVEGDEVPDAPLRVAAYRERVDDGAPAAAVQIDRPGPFAMRVAPGRYWVHASALGHGELAGWAGEPLFVDAGDAVDGVRVVVEAPDLVR